MSAARFLHELREKVANAHAHTKSARVGFRKEPRSVGVDLEALERALSEAVTMLDTELEQFTPVEIAKSSESSSHFRAVSVELAKGKP